MVDNSQEMSSEKQLSRLARAHSKLEADSKDSFYRLGVWVATHTCITLSVSIFLVILCMFGFANFSVESEGEKLWTPAESRSKSEEKIILTSFDDDTDFAVLLFTTKIKDGNVLTKTAFDELWIMNNFLYDIETDVGNTFVDLCEKGSDGITCTQPFRGPTRFWSSNYTLYQGTVSNDADILLAVNADTFPDGDEVTLEALFGNAMVFNETTGDLISAEAISQSYTLQSGTDEQEDEALEWEDKLQSDIDDRAATLTEIDLLYLTGQSIDDELAESVSGEFHLLAITYIMMIAFVCAVLGHGGRGCVGLRTLLGVGGIILVLLAMSAAYGINSAFGVPFTALSQILPFILVGIGVDDMFIIVAAYDHIDPSVPIPERVGKALARVGLSISYTSLTDFLAFMLGSTTSLPAVEYFCFYAGTAILFDYLLQVTAFVAFLAMDARRQKSGRWDCLCCISSSTMVENDDSEACSVSNPGVLGDKVGTSIAISGEVKTGEDGNARVAVGPVAAAHAPSLDCIDKARLSPIGRLMADKYAPVLLSKPGKLIALAATSALLAAGIYGITRASEGFDLVDLVPDDSYAREYYKVAREYDLDITSDFLPLNIYYEDVDYTDTAVQMAIQETDGTMVDLTHVSGPIRSWLTSFMFWAANGTEYSTSVDTSGAYPVFTEPTNFYGALADFQADQENARFDDDIVMADDNTIKISRSEMFLLDVETVDSNVDAIRSVRNVVDNTNLSPEPFAFSGVFIFTEQFLVMYKELLVNFALALVAVFVLSLFVLGSLQAAILACVTLVAIDVELLGFIYYWDLDINSITGIELIMAVGLVVDYMVHVLHFFLHQNPGMSKHERITVALGEIGPSVLLGATTTFVGIIPMAFASNVIFRVFFRMFLCIITFGVYHGLVFIPVAISILPISPKSPKNTSVTTVEEDANGVSYVS